MSRGVKGVKWGQVTCFGVSKVKCGQSGMKSSERLDEYELGGAGS